MAKSDKRRETGLKIRNKFTNKDIKAVQENVKVKKILICGIEPDEYSQNVFVKYCKARPDSHTKNEKLILETEKGKLQVVPAKGKGHTNDIEEKLELELKVVKVNLYVELQRNTILQEEFNRIKYQLKRTF
ncbi:hypothetical protein HAX54_030881 [Datura stramonium]|uniref:Transposase n=1 Tax=Datura stramonium TaxID=4076 RepID=A0ABS8V8A5_DATST|nr:hypothetical protein [Datura stramonium]